MMRNDGHLVRMPLGIILKDASGWVMGSSGSKDGVPRLYCQSIDPSKLMPRLMTPGAMIAFEDEASFAEFVSDHPESAETAALSRAWSLVRSLTGQTMFTTLPELGELLVAHVEDYEAPREATVLWATQELIMTPTRRVRPGKTWSILCQNLAKLVVEVRRNSSPASLYYRMLHLQNVLDKLELIRAVHWPAEDILTIPMTLDNRFHFGPEVRGAPAIFRVPGMLGSSFGHIHSVGGGKKAFLNMLSPEALASEKVEVMTFDQVRAMPLIPPKVKPKHRRDVLSMPLDVMAAGSPSSTTRP